jgi:hypothetical protein
MGLFRKGKNGKGEERLTLFKSSSSMVSIWVGIVWCGMKEE